MLYLMMQNTFYLRLYGIGYGKGPLRYQERKPVAITSAARYLLCAPYHKQDSIPVRSTGWNK